MAMVGLCNGERAVVLLVIIRICFSISIPLLWQGIALFLLACIGLFVEISVDNSSGLTCFKSRPGASSGILLGTVSLPTVMLSRLIQLSRAVSDHEVEPEELGYVNLYYWAASASSLGVLIFLSVVMSSLGNNRSSYRLGCGQAFYLFFFGVLSYLSLAAKSFGGSYVVAKLVWTFCHGLASVRLILHILRAFPSCASIGEALLVTGGLVLFFGEMLARTLTKVNVHSLSKKLISVQYGARRSEISILIQGLLLGLLLLPMFYKFVLRTWVYFTRLINSEAHTIEGRASGEIKKSVIFFGSLGVILTVAFPAWVQLVQDFELHPLLWILMYVFMEPFKRILLCMYWLGVICSSVLCFYKISKNNKTERILLRKYYHILAVVMFIPAFIFQPDFLDLAFGAALAVFLALEMIRVWRIWPLGHIVHHFMNAFTDHRDSDILIVSHFSLLLGCAIPKWMSSGFNDRPLTPFAGLLSLGIGDTMASMVGHKYGVLRWSKSGKKTIEGTAAGITSVLAACSVLLWLLASTGYIFSQHWLSLLLAVTLSGLLEAYTAQLDNAFIPLVFYSLLCL